MNVEEAKRHWKDFQGFFWIVSVFYVVFISMIKQGSGPNIVIIALNGYLIGGTIVGAIIARYSVLFSERRIYYLNFLLGYFFYLGILAGWISVNRLKNERLYKLGERKLPKSPYENKGAQSFFGIFCLSLKNVIMFISRTVRKLFSVVKNSRFSKYVFVALVVAGLFYWVELRPSNIRHDCELKAVNYYQHRYVTETNFNFYYETCLHSRGL